MSHRKKMTPAQKAAARWKDSAASEEQQHPAEASAASSSSGSTGTRDPQRLKQLGLSIALLAIICVFSIVTSGSFA